MVSAAVTKRFHTGILSTPSSTGIYTIGMETITTACDATASEACVGGACETLVSKASCETCYEACTDQERRLRKARPR